MLASINSFDDTNVNLPDIAWRTTSYLEFIERAAFRALWDYLTESAVSPLRRAFVEIEDPIASKVRCLTRLIFFLAHHV